MTQATITTYTRNNQIKWTATFTVSGTLTDPTTVTARVRAPDGTVTTPTVTNASTGVYTITVTADKIGKWHVRFEGTGTCVAAEENEFIVAQSQFYND